MNPELMTALTVIDIWFHGNWNQYKRDTPRAMTFDAAQKILHAFIQSADKTKAFESKG